MTLFPVLPMTAELLRDEAARGALRFRTWYWRGRRYRLTHRHGGYIIATWEKPNRG